MTITIERTETGSQLVAALENVWHAIRSQHPEVPDVVIITGSGSGMLGLTWGHFWNKAWSNGRFIVDSNGVAERARKHELFVSGETLGVGAVKTLQTMLHEASHALAAARDVKDTSRQHRYHNRRFLEIARELGLDYRREAPDATQGFSSVEITDAARSTYADEIAALDEAIALSMELPEWARLLGGSLGGTSGGDAHGRKRPRDPQRKSTSLAKATCDCGRIIRVSKSVLDQAPITCGDCGSDFTAQDES